MNAKRTGIMAGFLLFAMLLNFPCDIFVGEILVDDAEAYYGSYSAGNVQSTGRASVRGTGRVGGHYVTYYTNLPGNCLDLISMGVTYYNCGGDYYRPYYLGNQIVYVKEMP